MYCLACLKQGKSPLDAVPAAGGRSGGTLPAPMPATGDAEQLFWRSAEKGTHPVWRDGRAAVPAERLLAMHAPTQPGCELHGSSYGSHSRIARHAHTHTAACKQTSHSMQKVHAEGICLQRFELSPDDYHKTEKDRTLMTTCMAAQAMRGRSIGRPPSCKLRAAAQRRSATCAWQQIRAIRTPWPLSTRPRPQELLAFHACCPEMSAGAARWGRPSEGNPTGRLGACSGSWATARAAGRLLRSTAGLNVLAQCMRFTDAVCVL